jgi:hypothetical protein
MTLAAGIKLGSYEITGAIGAGGMGEVYKAHDTKLGRDVAIKVLPEAFAHDSERLSRFQREAKILASLNHPNIATIYGLEHSDGTHFLIMELVAGETLAERIKREGAVPVEEALKIGVDLRVSGGVLRTGELQSAGCGGVTEAPKNPRPHVNVIHLRRQFFQFSGAPVSEPRWGKLWC